MGKAEADMLTVVLPNFNHGRFLPHALQSLLAQTRPADELIIIDDASTDDSIGIIEAFLPKFRNAKLVRNARNLGVVRNMNIGLRMAHGSLLAFCAADDITYPTFFARMLELLRSYPQAAFASARSALIDESGDRIGVVRNPVPLDRPGLIEAPGAARLLMRDDAWFTGNATVFQRTPVLSIGGFPEDLSAFTDGYVSRVLAVQYGACFTPEILVAWRRMGGGVASSIGDLATAQCLARRAVQHMQNSGAGFAPGYPERWKGRFLYAVQRVALANARRKARSMGPWRFARALTHEVVKAAWLFVTLRPRDTFVALLRWLKKAD